MVNVWLAPSFTLTAPLGSMLPFAPAVAVMVCAIGANVAVTARARLIGSVSVLPLPEVSPVQPTNVAPA